MSSFFSEEQGNRMREAKARATTTRWHTRSRWIISASAAIGIVILWTIININNESVSVINASVDFRETLRDVKSHVKEDIIPHYSDVATSTLAVPTEGQFFPDVVSFPEFVKTSVLDYSKDVCDICDPNCTKTPEETALLQKRSALCNYVKKTGIDMSSWVPQSLGERFAVLTLFEPSWRVPDFRSIHNIIALCQSMDMYFPYQADHMILWDDSNTVEMRLIQRACHRRVLFVNVSDQFPVAPPNPSKYNVNRCPGDFSYRNMCRFGSGPMFWLDALKDLDYIIRIDEDAKFKATVPTNLVTNLRAIGAGYGYYLEQTSSSKCREGLNDLVVDFVNQVDHAAFGRPWIKVGDFKFFRNIPANSLDIVNVSAITKTPLQNVDDLTLGSLALDPKRNLALTYYVSVVGESLQGLAKLTSSLQTYNCNFEVASLAYFRHPHYRLFWQYAEDRDLFMKTRMGDHEIKTTYVDMFAPATKVGCYVDLPYYHHNLNNEWCYYNNIIYLFDRTAKVDQVHRKTKLPRG